MSAKKCPFCQSSFREYDDIVICSQCDMPHHKNCWVENGSCTTFGCLGTIMAVDPNNGPDSVTNDRLDFDSLFDDSSAQPQSQGIIYCTKCGNQNRRSSSFCIKCGSPLRTTAPQNNTQGYHQQSYTQYSNGAQSANSNQYGAAQQPLNSNDVRLKFIEENQYYYGTQFNEITSKNKKGSWNWCAFLFAPYWFIYRKMHIYGIGILVINYLTTLLKIPLVSYLLPCINVLAGIFANYIYMQHIDSLITQVSTMPSSLRSSFIVSKGGVNRTATVFVVIGYTILSLITGIGTFIFGLLKA